MKRSWFKLDNNILILSFLLFVGCSKLTDKSVNKSTKKSQPTELSISNSDIINTVKSRITLSDSLDFDQVKDDSTVVYTKRNSAGEITSTIISKQKIGNDYLVIFSETSTDPMKDCRSCSGDLVASRFSFKESAWKILSDHYFSAGGTWGKSGKLESVHSGNNETPMFVFRDTRTWAGGYGTGEILIFVYLNNKMVKVFDSEDKNLMLDHDNGGGCCLSLHSEIMIELKGIPYEEAFQIARQKYGKGYRFMWNDSVYTTYDPGEAFYGEGGICDPGEDGDYSTTGDNGSFYGAACFQTKSKYSFVYNKDNLLDDFVINISGTKQKAAIYNTDEY